MKFGAELTDMEIITEKNLLTERLTNVKSNGLKLGFVPTMGALHDGHLQLVKRSVQENDFTVVSIFVNPTQFNNPLDLEKYPRNLNADALLLENVGCDLIFAPDADEMYSSKEMNETFQFDFDGLDKVMEGKFRPGHFNGVVQVVSKLFQLVRPDKAYFGEKDFQQLAIIHRLNEVFGFQIDIIDCPIVREASGLAMSSRNERLSKEARENASFIHKVLNESRNFVPDKSPEEMKQWVYAQFEANQQLKIEYFELSNARTLQELKSWNEPAVGCIAVFCEEVRLIDNIRYN